MFKLVGVFASLVCQNIDQPVGNATKLHISHTFVHIRDAYVQETFDSK